MTVMATINSQIAAEKAGSSVLPRKLVRFMDHRSGRYCVKVLPGQIGVTKDPEDQLVTVLGSCIAACFYDPVLKLGGMNHFILPEGTEPKIAGEGRGGSYRFGSQAMSGLLVEMVSKGAMVNRMIVKIFGGAQSLNDGMGVGRANADYAARFCVANGLHVAAVDTGGRRGRRVSFCPETGKVTCHYLGQSADKSDVTSTSQTKGNS